MGRHKHHRRSISDRTSRRHSSSRLPRHRHRERKGQKQHQHLSNAHRHRQPTHTHSRSYRHGQALRRVIQQNNKSKWKLLHSSSEPPSSSSPSSSPSSSSSHSSHSSQQESSMSSSVSPQTRQRRKTPHFQYRVGEKIGHKYWVKGVLGTGTFGRVVQASYDGKLYAIKVIKPVRKYIQSARTERDIVKVLCSRDPHDEYHLVRFVESFHHHAFYCLVFEALGPSLYDITKKNKYTGFDQRQVQSFAKQLFKGVGYMHRMGYTHTDLKPQNILLCSDSLIEETRNEEHFFMPKHSKIKIIDFGGTTHKQESHSHTINTRQYRSPQVILQCCQWSQASDLWSIGCILVQLITGELLFHVHNDVDHIYMIDKICGRIPIWMQQRCQGDLERLFHPQGGINYRYGDYMIESFDEIMKLKQLDKLIDDYQLVCLVRQCLQIDPRQRITCQQALLHRYFDHRIS